MRTSIALTSFLFSFFLLTPVHAQEVRTGAEAFGTWEDDAPGVRRHITRDELPDGEMRGDPEAPDYERPPEIVDRPEDRMPDVPDGFNVEIFAENLTEPRVIRIAPNGDIFVAESEAGRIVVFAADAVDNLPAEPDVFAEGLEQPFGIAFYPADEPEYVYVGAANEVVRFPYNEGDREATASAEVIIPDIPTERHWTRDLAVSEDGERMFVAIGSASNVAADMEEMSTDEIEAHEQTHGRGATWGEEENRGVVRVFDPEGDDIRNYATGLRNCSGMTIQPETGTLWCTGNERDHLGPNVPPDYLTTVEEDGFYGWPWYHTGGTEDPAHAGERPDLQDEVIAPDVLIQSHSSTMQIVFYDADQFPEDYHGDAFATLRGSWNRDERTGYKVVRAIMEDGEATGEYEDFMTGFVLNEEDVWGRPTGLAVTPDGALLVSDDANGTIFLVTAEGSE